MPRLTNTSIAALPAKSTRYDVAVEGCPGLRLRVSPDGSKVYYLHYRVDGRQRRYRVGRHGDLTVAGARKLALAARAEVATGRDPQADRKQARTDAARARSRTWAAFVRDRYLPHVDAEHRAAWHTRAILEREFAWLGDTPLDAITPELIARWRQRRLADGVAATTLNRARGVIVSALSRACDWGLLDANPLSKVKRLKEDKQGVVRYLTEDEERRLRDALRARDSRWRAQGKGNPAGRFVDHLEPLLLLLRLTGARPGELFALAWADVNLERAVMTVRGTTAKTGQTRHVPLCREAVQILRDWPGCCNGLVFPAADGGKLVSVNKGWRRIRDDAGLVGFRLYDLRHSFASTLVMKGVDLLTVKELLGHSDYAMTLRYAHLAPEHKKSAVAVFDQ
jgi:integrase